MSTSAAFISYSREDSEFALRLAQDLKAAGAAVWLDQLDLKPGSSWDNSIEEALLAAPQMLVVLSPISVKSENVRDEISYALRLGKTIIPVLYMECVIPLRLERKQHIDFRSDYTRGLTGLLEQLHVDRPDQSVLNKAAEVEAKRHAAWEARETETQRLREIAQTDQPPNASPAAPPAPPAPEVWAGRFRWNSWTVVGGGLACLLLVGVIGFSMHGGSTESTSASPSASNQEPASTAVAPSAPSLGTQTSTAPVQPAPSFPAVSSQQTPGSYSNNAGGSTQDLPYFMTRELVASDLEGKSASDLDEMRNEIYARHGRKFANRKIQAYFSSQSWYTPTYEPDNFPTSLLTQAQASNILLLSHRQKELQ